MYPIFLHEHFPTCFSVSLQLAIKHVTTSFLPSCPSIWMALLTFLSIPQAFWTSLKTSRQSYNINLQCLVLMPPLCLWCLSNSEWLPEFQVNVYINCWVKENRHQEMYVDSINWVNLVKKLKQCVLMNHKIKYQHFNFMVNRISMPRNIVYHEEEFTLFLPLLNTFSLPGRNISETTL